MMYLINAVVFLIIAMLLNKKNLVDLMVRIITVGLFFANIFYALIAFGYLIKP
jgi:hypothetical protein